MDQHWAEGVPAPGWEDDECGDSSHRHYHGFYRDEAEHTITQYRQSWPHDGLVTIINILHYPYI